MAEAIQSHSAAPAETAHRLLWSFVNGDAGGIETVSILPRTGREGMPAIYFLVGWWGAASDYIAAMQHFASFGFPCRSFSWRGTGQSAGGSFWGIGYESDLIRVLRHFADPRVVVVAHSGALDYLVKALPKLQASGGHAIEAAVVIAPLARSGSIVALGRWLSFSEPWTLGTRWLRFLCSNVLGVSWFMRNELALRRVLLSDRVSIDVVRAVRQQIDRCPFGRYLLSLLRYPTFMRYPKAPFASLGVRCTLLLRPEHDRNFTHSQQVDTAEAIGAELQVLPNTCHQWFADPASFAATTRAMLSWLAENGVAPKIVAS